MQRDVDARRGWDEINIHTFLIISLLLLFLVTYISPIWCIIFTFDVSYLYLIYYMYSSSMKRSPSLYVLFFHLTIISSLSHQIYTTFSLLYSILPYFLHSPSPSLLLSQLLSSVYFLFFPPLIFSFALSSLPSFLFSCVLSSLFFLHSDACLLYFLPF